MRRQTSITNEIKHAEAQQLNAFLDTLDYRERVEFVTSVVQRVGIKRQTFMNWKAMACRIPERAKEIIEDEAGDLIFHNSIPSAANNDRNLP
ncbi:MAG: hypothetical protein K2N05_11125 [Muribaculaceae bacterium]|nr:hypothetical protein [Muribaculaceae bacterium]